MNNCSFFWSVVIYCPISVTRYWSKYIPQMFPKVAKYQGSFDIKWWFSKKPKKSPMFWGYFWKQICCQELSKITQSGHTLPNLPKLCTASKQRNHQHYENRNMHPVWRIVTVGNSKFTLPAMYSRCRQAFTQQKICHTTIWKSPIWNCLIMSCHF